jgi:acyl-CoA thioesterase YciA
MTSTADEPVQDTSSNLPQGMPIVRVIAMPADANPNGDIFAGWLFWQMDLAGGNLAERRALGRCTTVAVDRAVFHEPVVIGDEVSCYCEIAKTGRTSMGVRIEAWRRPRGSEELRKVTEAIFTYVAIDEDRRPRPLLPGVQAVKGR